MTNVVQIITEIFELLPLFRFYAPELDLKEKFVLKCWFVHSTRIPIQAV